MVASKKLFSLTNVLRPNFADEAILGKKSLLLTWFEVDWNENKSKWRFSAGSSENK